MSDYLIGPSGNDVYAVTLCTAIRNERCRYTFLIEAISTEDAIGNAMGFFEQLKRHAPTAKVDFISVGNEVLKADSDFVEEHIECWIDAHL